MSQLLISQYLNQLATLKKVSGSQRESVVREAFKDLLKGWAKQHDLVFIPEYEIETKTKERRYVDGALLYELRVPFGYWEAKDEKDDLEAEIEHKFKRGYPQDNIIFEDSKSAILIQDREEVMRALVDDKKSLEKLLNLFFGYERKEISEFRHAVEQFKTDLPAVLGSLRDMIDKAHAENAGFRKAAAAFLRHAQETINPTLGAPDVREMLIQHILTEEIFSAVFPGTSFHKDNNVARELYKLEDTFFTGNTKFKNLKGLEPYYASIRAAAAQIANHHEKQTFLKVIYENFYKVYNKKAADRLGVVYTPNEIVRFMIESTDWLCEKHFNKNLIDKDVEILDPATGTGTFISELLEHFRGQSAKLKHKYLEELHANEVAILPYYVANLNIEATYSAIAGEYVEFPNLCFVDTLDNVGLHTAQTGTQASLFGSVTEENVARIRRQNSRRISVVIGNPPYNANQLNANDENKNRAYPEIDKRIKNTYIAKSAAQAKNKVYDMFVRFFRWASDRIDQNGIVAFVSNSTFIDSRAFDGFRKIISAEFNEVWIVDLKGNARTSGEQRRKEGGNIFSDQIRVGIAVYFCVKRQHGRGCRILYEAVRDYAKADEKKDFLTTKSISERKFRTLSPDEKGNWLQTQDEDDANDLSSSIPLLSKEAKRAKTSGREKAILKLFSMGVTTNRDDWLYGDTPKEISAKVRYFLDRYRENLSDIRRSVGRDEDPEFDLSIKWTRALRRLALKGREISFDPEKIVDSFYRPFCRRRVYFASELNEYMYDLPSVFRSGKAENISLNLSVGKEFRCLATDSLVDLHFLGDTQLAPLYRYAIDGTRISNVTDWALEQFKKKYQPGRTKLPRSVGKEAIFHYVYGVLHDTEYRAKFAVNLKRDLPRIPLYPDFWQWADWGEALMKMHVGYGSAAIAKLKRTDLPDEKAKIAGQSPRAILKADKQGGRIIVDSETSLAGVPPEAWEYKLGNLSALEWVLDQYKESKPKDPTIREKFDTYRFADYKEKIIDLLARVTTVSVETQKIVEAMRKTTR